MLILSGLGFDVGDEGGEGEGVFDVVIPYLGAAEGSEVTADAESLADIFAEGADVGAAGDFATDLEVGPGII